jgi:hypothetical protein
MNMTNFTPIQLRKAADLQEKIAQLQSNLAAILGSEVEAAPVAKPARKKGGMSAAGRARIAAAQKARWAKVNAAKGKTIAEKVIQAVKTVIIKPAKKKFTMSAAAKAKISAAAKARWAKIKVEKAVK